MHFDNASTPQAQSPGPARTKGLFWGAFPNEVTELMQSIRISDALVRGTALFKEGALKINVLFHLNL